MGATVMWQKSKLWVRIWQRWKNVSKSWTTRSRFSETKVRRRHAH